MDLQLRHLRALVTVADTGTFTDAGAELGVSQAAVSRAIAALEEALGVPVLERTTRRVALTATGTQVLAGARRILDEITHLRRLAESRRGELRIGYAWAALGKHTRRLQRAWATGHPGTPLVFVHTNTPSAGLSDGTADVAVIRRPLDDPRFATALIGAETRCAAVATDNPLARRRTLHLRDLARYPVAVDARTGTTTLDLWHPGPQPAEIRTTHGVDEWLTLIAAGQAVGVTSEATANQNPRPGVAYRTLRQAARIDVRLAWWRDDPPAGLDDLVRLSRAAYASGLP
ncbi:DNA-binding transcriptional LysR family regulator [Actinoplanes campanulatus]|uniref:DNA-binding transcriptional LysR family regulator n=1 Tax=Actinoplanes campanulatus TaxID=113559 RepID=A0A7W5AM31_9ACTN|nr:LysR family transcriptional regulator [Actinoplanes campanulatus]MBB3098586.1 DNA-binding transcriptional LysR family regulator [Actinoplanes campanulatus]GGN36005.1 LysR family transcriptional regulator [Actinoplanes campanulatus]GID39277.1 LysR family transcriptional regulator [Actinoplanes campanulatus]